MLNSTSVNYFVLGPSNHSLMEILPTILSRCMEVSYDGGVPTGSIISDQAWLEMVSGL